MTENMELVYGIHPVTQVLRNKKRRAEHLYVLDGKAGHKAVESIIRMAKSANVKIDRMEAKVMDRLTKGANHQGVALKAAPLTAMRLSEAIDAVYGDKKQLWLAVDGITDPQNLGSIIRSAACLGFSTLLLPKRRTVGLTPTVYRVASGAVERMTIVEVANLNSALLDLKEEGFWIYGADMKGTPLNKVTFNAPAVLVMGAEGEGMKNKTMEHSDELVSIPQADTGLDSLNVSNAAAIIMYEMYAQSALKK